MMVTLWLMTPRSGKTRDKMVFLNEIGADHFINFYDRNSNTGHNPYFVKTTMKIDVNCTIEKKPMKGWRSTGMCIYVREAIEKARETIGTSKLIVVNSIDRIIDYANKRTPVTSGNYISTSYFIEMMSMMKPRGNVIFMENVHGENYRARIPPVSWSGMSWKTPVESFPAASVTRRYKSIPTSIDVKTYKMWVQEERSAAIIAVKCIEPVYRPATLYPEDFMAR
jgi:hypothetical protein